MDAKIKEIDLTILIVNYKPVDDKKEGSGENMSKLGIKVKFALLNISETLPKYL